MISWIYRRLTDMTNEASRLTILTSNENKAQEFSRLLDVELERVAVDIPEIQETDVTVVARKKAEEGFSKLNRPCFVDDTGLTVHAWGNLPGALIKWFIDNVGNNGFIAMLGGTTSRKATVTTALGYCDKNGSQVFVGELHGTIASAPRGNNGFGYDPIFIPEGQDKTFAEMTDAERDAISMRALAVKAMKAGLF